MVAVAGVVATVGAVVAACVVAVAGVVATVGAVVPACMVAVAGRVAVIIVVDRGDFVVGVVPTEHAVIVGVVRTDRCHVRTGGGVGKRPNTSARPKNCPAEKSDSFWAHVLS